MQKHKITITMRYFLFILLCSFSICSCIQYKEIVGFQGIHNIKVDTAEIIANRHDMLIQPDNLLNIQVQSLDPDINKAFNAMEASPQVFQNQQNVENFVGYYVDSDGNIDFPIVGKIKVSGLTITQAKNLVTEKTSTYLKGAAINMRFLNLKVTVLGEVKKPGVVKFSNKRITLLEAIGESGDFTEFAKRDTVLLIREVGDKRTTARLNLQDKSFLSSPYYYLEQNDVVVVEPLQFKIHSLKDKSDKTIPFVTAGASVLSAIAAVIAYIILVKK